MDLRLFRGLYLVVCVILISALSAEGQVTAGFTISAPVPNCNPAIYSFTNTSTGTGTLSYQWNFGVFPGVNSVFKNPSTTYLGCGSYIVKLVVTNNLGQKDSSIQTVNIRCSPAANFGASNLSGCVPFATNFISKSSPGSGTINTYEWDFGDGNSSTSQSPSHTYYEAGCKNVTLIVSNTFGCIKDTTITNVLCTYQQPVSAFTSSATSSCTFPFKVNYQATSSSGLAPYSYQWIFQGATPATSTSANPSVTYNNPGSYTVSLITSDVNGCSDTLTKTAYISVGTNTADFTLSKLLACVPTTISATATSNGTPLAFNWSSTPSLLITGPKTVNPTFTFTDSGSYNICLTIDFGSGCTAQKCTTIVASNPPVASSTPAGLLNTCHVPDTITFNFSPDSNLIYNWAFPGGSPAAWNATMPPPVSYTQCGLYSSYLTVTDKLGCRSTYIDKNFLTINCLSANFTATPQFGCLPLTTTFSSSGNASNVVSWLWNFGDSLSGSANTSTLPNPTHTFNYPGCHTISLTTTTADGCTFTKVMPDEVCAGHRPHANFSGNPPVTCANKPVTFIDSSTGTYDYTTYVWDFHGGPPFLNESNQKNPIYIYDQIGTYTVTEIVENYGCADTITKDDYVQTVVPIAYPKAIQTCNNKLSVTLDGTASTGAQSYLWTIPGATPSTDTNAIVTVSFPANGDYSASLFVLNDSTGCSDLQPVKIHISSVQANFTASPVTACNQLLPAFSNTSSNAASYYWQITNAAGAQVYQFTYVVNPRFYLTAPGYYNVLLVATDSLGCRDTLYRPHYLSVDQPAANFKALPRSGCAPMNTTMVDISSYPTQKAASWSWNFGDVKSGPDNVSSLPNPSHLYTYPGFYTVSLAITDSSGCTSDTAKFNYMHVSQPSSGFTYSETTSCKTATLCFSNNSHGEGLTYSWNFGDSTTAKIADPCHNFTSNGTYNIVLVATDSLGCKDTSITAGNVNIIIPHPNFVADTTSSTCPPLLVNFTNLSTDTNAQTTYLWNFGDGQVSSLQNPIHIYNIPGTFTVSLVATRNGCSDTVVFPKYIYIGGPSGFATSAPTSGCAPHYVCLTAKSQSTVTYTWNFGDGTVTPGPDSICYSYSRPGTFYPELILTDEGGCIFALPLGTVNITAAAALFGIDSSLYCRSGNVSFSDSSSGTPGIQNWNWNFGDSASGITNISTQVNPAHYYASPGLYQVKEVVSNSAGCTDSLVQTVTITKPPAVSFALDNPTICLPDTVSFIDKTTSPTQIVSRLWNFGEPASGNADTSTQKNPKHLYTQKGNYTITLIEMSASGCADTFSSNVATHAKPVAAFAASNKCKNQQPVSFNDNSKSATTYQWYFGDGTSSSLLSPQHTYADTGQFYVKLVAGNSFCYDSVTSPVKVLAIPTAAASLSASYLCGSPAQVQVINNSSGYIRQIWNFGDVKSGNSDTSTQYSASHTYTNQGNFAITLITFSANGCTDTTVNNLSVYPKPAAGFTAANACLNAQPINFTNGSVNTNTYKWLFGDGDTSVLPNPQHTYKTASQFQVTLISNISSCADTFKAPVEVYPLPQAKFSLSQHSFCGAPAILATNYAGAEGSTYLWNFGDSLSGANNTSSLENAVHRYSNPGTFVVTLSVTGVNGCSDTSQSSLRVDSKPDGIFTSFDTCLNTQPIVFANYVSNATGYTWYFGDGDSSVQQNPAHTYNHPGSYTVMLVASNDVCADTLQGLVKIYTLPDAAFALSSASICGPPANVSTSNASTGANTYLWNFGNGNTSDGVNPLISYNTAGQYEITLVAMSGGGCNDTASKPFLVMPKPTIQGIDLEPAGGCAPVKINLNANAPGANLYTWNFGDSSTAVSAASSNATYIYNDTGSYTISLFVSAANGCTDSAVLTDTVQVHVQPVADFDTLIYSNSYPFDGTVVFVNMSQNGDSYLWEFGDGATATDFNPQHRYDNVNTFSTTLITETNYGCIDSITKSFFVIKKALYVPNALRPDFNDGENLVKVWKPLGIGLKYYHAQIFDKWGTLLWESDALEETQPSESWDGTYHGQPCQQDAYVWKISATFVDGSQWQGMTYEMNEGGGTKTVGSVTLLR